MRISDWSSDVCSSDLILLDGKSLTQRQLAGIAYGAPVELSADALSDVARAAAFLAEQVRREEPIYGVSTGFGSNADKLLRSAERRVGKEWGSPCRSRRLPYI